VAHYDDVFASLVANGIKPAVTLFHWVSGLPCGGIKGV